MTIRTLLFAFITFTFFSCGGGEKKTETKKAAPVVVKTASINTNAAHLDDKGVGPITSVTLGAIDDAMVAEGKSIFKAKCSACHKISKRFVGPALKGVTKIRSSEWIMNMIMNPEGMVKENPLAKKLLEEYSAPMANQNLTEKDARAILEYFRTKN